MKGTHQSFKKYIEECIQSKAQRKKLSALLSMLSVVVAITIVHYLMQPAITVSAMPQCGHEAHVHTGDCYETHTVCGLDGDESHIHDASCCATVLTCTREQHSHTEACYPKTIVEETLPPVSVQSAEIPADEIAVKESPAEVTAPTQAPTEAPTEAPTTEPTAVSTLESTPAPQAFDNTIAPEPTVTPDAFPTSEPTQESNTSAPLASPAPTDAGMDATILFDTPETVAPDTSPSTPVPVMQPESSSEPDPDANPTEIAPDTGFNTPEAASTFIPDDEIPDSPSVSPSPLATETAYSSSPSPAPTETPAPTEAPAILSMISDLQGTERMGRGETGVWKLNLTDAQEARYTIIDASGNNIAQGALDVHSTMAQFSAAIDPSGLYTVSVTASNENGTQTECLTLAVSAGTLKASVSTDVYSCFAGDTIALDLSAQGGVAPLNFSIVATQNGESFYESDAIAQGTHTISLQNSEKPTEVSVHLTVTDACGDTATSEMRIPCAVRQTESRRQWERSFADVHLSGLWHEDLIAIARTQLGYKESKTNFIIDANGKQYGYTRYGDWYGADYTDWCAMYVAFCLHYAQIPESDFPQEANCEKWIRALSRMDLYSDASIIPQTGDLVFFDWDDDHRADHVGIIESVDDHRLTTIEGNADNQVCRREYALNDTSILGYGLLNVAYANWMETHTTVEPSVEPTIDPSVEPTIDSSGEPTIDPSVEPTVDPSV